MARTFDPQAAARRWAQRLGSARDKIKAGVEAVTESPMDKAADAADDYLAGKRRAVESGKYQAGLRRVSLAEWKRKFLSKGLDRIATGAADAEGEFAAFLTEMKPHLDSIQAGLATMPKGKGENNFNRMVFNYREMEKFHRTK